MAGTFAGSERGPLAQPPAHDRLQERPRLTVDDHATPVPASPDAEVEPADVGAEVFIVAAADTCMARPSRELMAEVYPDVEVRGELGEHETLLSIAKARRLLGYEPQHGWRDHVSS